MTAPILMTQLIRLLKTDLWLMLHDAELTDPVALVNLGIAQGICREKPLIPVSAIYAAAPPFSGRRHYI